jgi:hypothetical protein
VRWVEVVPDEPRESGHQSVPFSVLVRWPVEGGTADTEGLRHLVHGLVSGERGPGRGEFGGRAACGAGRAVCPREFDTESDYRCDINCL